MSVKDAQVIVEKNLQQTSPKSQDNQKSVFGFQWHITNQCNLRCLHCYHTTYSQNDELDTQGLKSIANHIFAVLSKWQKTGDIALTGGEPLLRNDLFELVNYLEESEYISSIDILTNGTLTNNHILGNILNMKKLRCVQVSLDGASELSHDAIRGKGTFSKTLKNIEKLISNHIRVNVMFTLQRRNMDDILDLIELSRNVGVSTLTIERFVPLGNGKENLGDQILTPIEIQNVFNFVYEKSQEKITDSFEISMSRPLWILCENSSNHSNLNKAGGICSIGLDGLCILPDATVLACRRLPIPIGNLKHDTLEKIWFQSELLWQIRDKNNIKGECGTCEFLTECSGCRAITYAITGDYLNSDPQCWKQY